MQKYQNIFTPPLTVLRFIAKTVRGAVITAQFSRGHEPECLPGSELRGGDLPLFSFISILGAETNGTDR